MLRALIMVASAGSITCAAAQGLPASEPARTPPSSSPAATPAPAQATTGTQLDVVAEFKDLQATGVAVSKTGRLFVCFPRWHDSFKHSLVEVSGGVVKPYPNDVWNSYVENTEEHRGIQFVCVQSVKVDDADRLWVLDAASPRMEGVKRSQFDGGGPKLIEIDLATDKPRRVFRIPGAVALPTSYLNDFEIDAPNNIAYITDSGDGALILVNLRTYETKRVLDRHAALKPDPAFVPVIAGSELRGKDGLVPKVGADGIALDRANGYLYFQPLTGNKLYRIKTQVLIDVLPGRTLTGEQKNTLAAAVEEVDQTVMTDGMIFDPTGNLYFSAVEKNAIVVRTPDGTMHDLVAGEALAWPDSFAIGPAIGSAPKHAAEPTPPATDAAGASAPAAVSSPQYLYFTTSQIHLTRWFTADGSMPTEPYRVFRTRLFTR